MLATGCQNLGRLNRKLSEVLYTFIVIPKSLYGCEYMDNFTDSEKLMLEWAHRVCIKRIQSLGIYTRTDIALISLNGIFLLEIEKDVRILTLFGQFCSAWT